MARPTIPIKLSPAQNELLQSIARSRVESHSLVQRAQIVLRANGGCNNKAIAAELGVCEETVGLWRKRWVAAQVELDKWEGNPMKLREAVNRWLTDQPRPGCPGTFSAEQICQILAVACEKPPESISHWTCPELTREVVRRGIVEQISKTTMGRFLKSGGSKTSSEQILTQPHHRR